MDYFSIIIICLVNKMSENHTKLFFTISQDPQFTFQKYLFCSADSRRKDI